MGQRPSNWYLVGLALLLLHEPCGLALGSESEGQLLERLKTEQNPVRRAKLEIKLGDLKLDEARGAYGKGDVEAGAKLLMTFLGHMKSAWKILQESGRKAPKQPQGFKELDISLREDARSLDDLGRKVAYFDRAPIEQCAKEIEGMRAEVLRALFPATAPRTSGAPAPPKSFAAPIEPTDAW